MLRALLPNEILSACAEKLRENAPPRVGTARQKVFVLD